MIRGKLEHNLAFNLDEVSENTCDTYFDYGEYNGAILTAINETAPDGNLVLICDNVIKFIEYRPSECEHEHYREFRQKQIRYKFTFSSYIISKAFADKDYEILEFQFKRINQELDRLLEDPYSLCMEEENGIAITLFNYFNECILMSAGNDEQCIAAKNKLSLLAEKFEINF